jgi:undecaprenyl-diphosphatase
MIDATKPTKRRARPPRWVYYYYGFLLVSLTLFGVLAQGVYQLRSFAFDDVILNWLSAQRTTSRDHLALALDVLGISYFLGFVITLMALFLWPRSRRSSIFVVLGFWGAIILNLIAKDLFNRTRPDLFEQLTPITNSSFPSGHAMGSFAFFLVCLLLTHYLSPRDTWITALFGSVFALAVGTSRLYLQVHYPSDVLAGWALSTAWVLGLGYWYQTQTPLQSKSTHTTTVNLTEDR